mmetsp:Transcript_1688/g.4208  ORF Transcript_1688/g.4208 Transcript_1688/m.4208 type:complete len:227 (-) Transcript_1688:680-1360(-)
MSAPLKGGLGPTRSPFAGMGVAHSLGEGSGDTSPGPYWTSSPPNFSPRCSSATAAIWLAACKQACSSSLPWGETSPEPQASRPVHTRRRGWPPAPTSPAPLTPPSPPPSSACPITSSPPALCSILKDCAVTLLLLPGLLRHVQLPAPALRPPATAAASSAACSASTAATAAAAALAMLLAGFSAANGAAAALKQLTLAAPAAKGEAAKGEVGLLTGALATAAAGFT